MGLITRRSAVGAAILAEDGTGTVPLLVLQPVIGILGWTSTVVLAERAFHRFRGLVWMCNCLLCRRRWPCNNAHGDVVVYDAVEVTIAAAVHPIRLKVHPDFGQGCDGGSAMKERRVTEGD